METHEIDVFVRFSETDAAGHVNNTSYFLYLEEARTKFFQSLGFGEEQRNSNLNFILASTNCDYISQAFAGQTLKVSTHVAKIGKKSFTVEHVIRNTASDIVARSHAVLVCFNYDEQTTEIIPDSLRSLLENKMVKHTI